jgi:hypothetical protein
MQEKNACNQEFFEARAKNLLASLSAGEPPARLALHARLLACLGRRVSSLPKGALE